MGAHRSRLADGRWHFGHGPIDLVIGADGDPAAVASAHDAAWRRFEPLLGELVAELPSLRTPVGEACTLRGAVARRMWHACRPFAAGFITPMAAVAGSVAEELIGCYARDGVERAWVNNGGDIALHLAPGRSVRVGLYADLARLDGRQVVEGLEIDGRFRVDHEGGCRGIATSGWRGRSFSLGIADSVTVLARTAARADAAATVIANAVDTDHPGIVRRPACELLDDSDLGGIEVTVDVPALPAGRVHDALARGTRVARELCGSGLILSALLACQGRVAACGAPAPDAAASGPSIRRSGTVLA